MKPRATWERLVAAVDVNYAGDEEVSGSRMAPVTWGGMQRQDRDSRNARISAVSVMDSLCSRGMLVDKSVQVGHIYS